MRREQAEALIARLEAAYGRGLDGDTKDIYIGRLMTLPFATALKRIELLINTSKFFPKVAELMKPVEGEVQQINAHIEDRWLDTDDGRYSCYRSEKLVELGRKHVLGVPTRPGDQGQAGKRVETCLVATREEGWLMAIAEITQTCNDCAYYSVRNGACLEWRAPVRPSDICQRFIAADGSGRLDDAESKEPEVKTVAKISGTGRRTELTMEKVA